MKPQGPYHCPTCNKQTSHTATLQADLVLLVCDVCHGKSATLTADQMRSKFQEQVAQYLNNHAPFEAVPELPAIKVFVKHHLGEAEVSQASLLMHMRVTGKAPVAGDKLMALPQGMAHKAFAIPVGEIVRVIKIDKPPV